MSAQAQDILNAAYARGYAKLSKRDLLVATIAAEVLSGDATSMLAEAIGSNYLALTEYDVAECIAQVTCATPADKSAVTLLQLAMQNRLSSMSRMDLDSTALAILYKQTNLPCNTPIAPDLKAVSPSPSDPFTKLRVRWKNSGNTGSLIIGWIVYWGTTSGGPYTNQSSVQKPSGAGVYDITGLTSGTTYYVVVQAVTAISGCVSANSNERSGTTSGSGGVHLLDTLIHYYQMDTVPGPLVDAMGTYTLGNGGAILNVAGGILGECITTAGGGLVFTAAGVDATWQLGPGLSFTQQLWVKPQAVPGNNVSGQDDGILANSSWNFHISAGPIFAFSVIDSAGNVFTIGNFGVVNTTGVWQHIIVGYDSANKQIFAQLNAGARVTQAVGALDLNQNGVTNLGWGRVAAAGNYNGNIDELGWWKRVLTTAEVTALYNGGAGLPFSSFTP